MLRALVYLVATTFWERNSFCSHGGWLAAGLWRWVGGFWAVWGTISHDFQVGFLQGLGRASLPWETSRGRDSSVMCVLSQRKTPLKGSFNWPQTIEVCVHKKYYTSECTECGERPHKTAEKDRYIHTYTLLLLKGLCLTFYFMKHKYVLIALFFVLVSVNDNSMLWSSLEMLVKVSSFMIISTWFCCFCICSFKTSMCKWPLFWYGYSSIHCASLNRRWYINPGGQMFKSTWSGIHSLIYLHNMEYLQMKKGGQRFLYGEKS